MGCDNMWCWCIKSSAEEIEIKIKRNESNREKDSNLKNNIENNIVNQILWNGLKYGNYDFKYSV